MRDLLFTRKIQHSRKNFALAANGKESRPAGIAAVGRQPQKSPQAQEHSVFDSFAGNSLQIKIAAARTVRVTQKHECDAPGIESPVAGAASPGEDSRGAECEVGETAPVRAETVCTPALRTDHPAVHLLASRGCRILEM